MAPYQIVFNVLQRLVGHGRRENAPLLRLSFELCTREPIWDVFHYQLCVMNRKGTQFEILNGMGVHQRDTYQELLLGLW
jgi:hypothetical protein